ncbi:tetratricopeptide repeat protein [Holophaga foetida]|uniref:tetratricopeptide repeat protein n=1 Tax=Holophaga foetida TaxID=35839 RepID=UPI000247179D|nr:tetratricopeptide repeat protein [Holophaga foetida]
MLHVVPALLFTLSAPQPTLAELFARPDPAAFLAAARPLAEKGEAEAQFLLGKAHHQGKGVEEDLGEAERWYRLSAAQHHPKALNNLGLLEIGQGAYGAAREHLQEALALGLKLPTLFNLGTACTEGGWRSPAELEEGAEFFLRARAEGYGTGALDEAVRALVVAAVMQQARGEAAPDPHYLELQARILKLGEEARTLKLPRSLQNVGVIFYESGRFREALPWVREAADLGQPMALYTLGLMAEGGHGMAKDPQAAEAWFEKAAVLGQESAQHRVRRHWGDAVRFQQDPAGLEGALTRMEALQKGQSEAWLEEPMEEARDRLAVIRELEVNARRERPLPPGPVVLDLALYDMPPEEGGMPLWNTEWRVYRASPQIPADGYLDDEIILAQGRLDRKGRTVVSRATARRLRAALDRGETLVFQWPGQRRLLVPIAGPKGEIHLGFGLAVRY